MNTQLMRERRVALFVGSTVILSIAFVVVWSITRGSWKSTVTFRSVLSTAEGVRTGTAVELSGVRIGKISRLEFTDNAEVVAEIAIFKEYAKHIRQDSRVRLLRPFVVGDKILVVTPGTAEAGVLAAGSMLPADEVVGLAELLNGSKLIPYMKTLEDVASELRQLAELMVKKKGSESVVRVLQALPPLVERVAKVSEAFAKNAPQFSDDFGRMVGNLASMTDEFKKVLPSVAAIAPELPKSSKRVVEALDEAVVVLKAMQKTFLLRSSVREVRQEEASRDDERAPASK